MAGIDRAEHLAWAKQRALEYLDRGDLQQAVASMGMDLEQHPDFTGPVYGMLTFGGLIAIREGPDAVRRWIEGFH